MINYDTIKSVYEDKLTLMQWLVKVQKALKDATAVSFNVNKTGDATLTFSILFDDGTELETAPIVLEQGESVESATLRNGHLILTLTNGDELDAGNMGAVSSFSIDANQHLIVNYQDGSTNDLGAIFSGNVNISGDLTIQGAMKQSLPNMSLPFSFSDISSTLTITNIYNRFEVIGNILYLVVNLCIENEGGTSQTLSASSNIKDLSFSLPPEYADVIYDLAGKKVSEAATPDYALITGTGVISATSNTYGDVELSDWFISICNRAVPNLLQIFIGKQSSVTINAGGKVYLTGRLALTLL